MTGGPRPRGRLHRSALAFGAWLLWGLLLVPGAYARTAPLRPGPTLACCALSFVLVAWLLRPGARRAARRYATIGVRGLGRGWPWVLLAAVAFAAYSQAAALLSTQLYHGRHPPGQEPYPFAGEPLGWLVLPLVVVGLASLVEELMFRGQLQPRLARVWGHPVGMVVAAAAFAPMHGSADLLPYFFAGGLLLGYARLAVRSIWAPILLHAAANLVAAAGVGGWLPAGWHPGDWLSDLGLGALGSMLLTLPLAGLCLAFLWAGRRPRGGGAVHLAVGPRGQEASRECAQHRPPIAREVTRAPAAAASTKS